MNLRTLNLLLILWYIGIVTLSPILLGFIGYMLFGFLFSGFGSNEPDTAYLLIASLPAAVIIFVTIKQHKMKKAKAQESMKVSIRNEVLSQKQLSPENTILTALKYSQPLNLEQLSRRTDISSAELLPLLGTLVDENKVIRSSSLDGIYFRRAD